MRAFLIAILLIPSFAFAEIKADLSDISISAALKIIFQQGSKFDYIISPDVLEDKRLISFRANISGKKTDVLLASIGLESKNISGLNVIQKINPEKEVQIYRSNYRSANYLIKQIQGMTDVEFINQRKIQTKTESAAESIPGTASAELSSGADIVVMKGTFQETKTALKLLKELDTKPRNLMADALLVEFQSTKSNEDSLTALSNIAPGIIDTTKSTIQLGTGSIQAILKAMQTDSRFKTVSRPKLLLTDGETSVFEVGDEVPILQSTTIQQNGAATQNIQYRPSGVILKIFSRIHEKLGRLELEQTLSGFIQTTTGVNSTPTLQKRMLKTVFDIEPGQGVLIAGLTLDRDSNQERGFFGLKIFKSESKSSTQTLLLISVHDDQKNG